MTIDVAGLYERIEELAGVGRVPGVGLWRRPLTPAEAEAVRRVSAWMVAAGLEVRRDDAGNLFGRVGPAGPRVLVGSHLDSVKNGGAYDGVLGVLGPLAALDALRRQHGEPRRAVEIVAWTGEEGDRYPGFVGSRAFCGLLGAEDLDRRDEDGVPLRDALAAAGFDPAALPTEPPRDVTAYLELHIEQGRVLESRRRSVGVVEAIVGLRQFTLTVSGRADHAGTTPMDLRHDALRTAAEIVLAASRRVERAGAPAVLTCGRIEARPGAVNVVAAEARLTLDLRDADGPRLGSLAAEIESEARGLAARAGCALAWSTYHDTPPVRCDASLVELIERQGTALGMEPLRMVSGAGHDAQILAGIAPAAMLFVPSQDGRSHCPEEYTSPAMAGPGLAVLAASLRALAW